MGEKKINVGAVVLTYNSEEMIKDCLESLDWVDEILVVDGKKGGRSLDKTVEIAKKFSKVKVAECLKGITEKRNYSIGKISGEWVLYLDSDERITPALRDEIQKTLRKPSFDAYAIPRKNILLGHEMKHGGWWPDYVLRLIKKESLIKWDGDLHEQPKIKGVENDSGIGKLKNPITHISHRDIKSMIKKTNEWSEIEANLLYKSNHPKMNIIRFCSAGFREFWYRGIRKMGFLDGPVGAIEVFYQTYSRLITYAKLWEMQIKEK